MAVPAPPDPLLLIDPPDPYPGSLSVLARASRLSEIAALQRERQRRVWQVRGVVSDHIPLVGDGAEVLARPAYHKFQLERSPLTIFLQSAAGKAVYYDLVSNAAGQLEYIGVQVETDLPSDALLLARRPLNALLDNFVANNPIPLTLQRLDLVSPNDGAVLLHELILPFRDGVSMGELAGIWERTPFVLYDAIFREAITSASPFYRLLCAYKIHDGADEIRAWLRRQREQRNIEARLPGEIEVNSEELLRLGFLPEFVEGIRTSRDLFNKLRDTRDAIAHFFIERGDGSMRVYLADGAQLRVYSVGSAALLKYARMSIEALRAFYATYLERYFMGGLFPTPGIRDRFIIRG